MMMNQEKTGLEHLALKGWLWKASTSLTLGGVLLVAFQAQPSFAQKAVVKKALTEEEKRVREEQAKSEWQAELHRTDYKTGKFSTDVALYNDVLTDILQATLVCRQTVVEHLNQNDGTSMPRIKYEVYSYWRLKGLSQTQDDPKGAEVTYYPALRYDGPNVDWAAAETRKTGKFDRSFEVKVVPRILENPEKPGHAANPGAYAIEVKMTKRLEGLQGQEGALREAQLIERTIEMRSPSGVGNVSMVPLSNEANEVWDIRVDPASTTYNTRNFYKGLVFSPKISMEFVEGPSTTQKVTCRVCSAIEGTFFLKSCGDLTYGDVQAEAAKVNLSQRGPLYLFNWAKSLKGSTNVGEALKSLNPGKKAGN